MTVECRCCHQTFEGGAPTQAYKCACNVYDGFIYGHYGSSYDTRMLRLTIELPNMDPICDYCIDALIRRSEAVDEREYLDFNESGGRGPN